LVFLALRPLRAAAFESSSGSRVLTRLALHTLSQIRMNAVKQPRNRNIINLEHDIINAFREFRGVLLFPRPYARMHKVSQLSNLVCEAPRVARFPPHEIRFAGNHDNSSATAMSSYKVKSRALLLFLLNRFCW
jgi:hypothetical protein